MKLSIKLKFSLTLALVVLATALSGIVSLAAVRATSGLLKELEESRLQSLLLARDARAAFQRFNKDIEVALSTQETSTLSDGPAIIAGIHRDLTDFSRINGSFGSDIHGELDTFVVDANKFLALRTKNLVEASALIDAGATLNKQRTSISAQLGNIEATANAKFESHLDEIRRHSRRSTYIAFGMISLVTLITVTFSSSILTTVLRRIRRIGLHFAGTDIDKIDPLTSDTSSDELGELAAAANRMLLGIKDSRRALVDKKLVDSVMEALVDAVLVTNHDGTIKRVNQAGSKLLQMPAESLVGMALIDLLGLDTESKTSDPGELLAQVFAQHTVSDQLSLKLPGDNTVAVALVGAPLAGGDIGAAAVFVLQDLTLARRREAELRTIQGQLVQSSKLASLGTLGAGVAHELNNPLTAVLGFAEVIGSGAVAPERTKELAANIVRASLRMRKIIDHLRTFSADTSRQKKKPISLNAVIQDSLILLGKQFADHRISIRLKLQDSLPRVQGDANQLESVIQNLLTNARDAFAANLRTQDAEIVIESWTTSTGWAAVAVTDNGQGIKESDRERIFDPFFTTKEVGKGTGLGLSITHSIVKDHDGKLELASTVGVGTKFTLTFPPAAAAEPAVRPTLVEPIKIAPKEVRKPTVLIIDDEEMIGEVLCMSLEEQYSVTYVSLPVIGCERFLGEPFDLLITDMRMPKMNGLEVIHKIRAARPLARILVITGHAQNEADVKQAIQAGALGVIPKPFPKQDDLLRMIAAALSPELAAAG